MRRVALLALLLTAPSGCAGLREARQERRDIVAEDEAQQAMLDGTTKTDALIAIARARQARGDVDVLQSYTRHADPRARREAVRALGLVGDPGTQGTIEAALQDTDAEVRAAAAFALSQLWAWPLAPLERVTAEAAGEVALDAALDEERTELRRGTGSEAVLGALVRALGEIGDEPTAGTLWALAGDDTTPPSVRRQAFFALGVRGKRGHALGEAEVPKVAAGLQGGQTFPAAWAVARSPVEDPAKPALEAALIAAWDGADGDAAAWILRALGRTGGEGAIALWSAALRDGDPRNRLGAVRGATEAGATAVLIAAAQDPDDQVAAEALTGLGGSPSEEAWAALQPREGGSPGREAARLRGLAGQAAGEGPAPHADELLAAGIAAAADDRAPVRAAAADLLGAHPDPAAADALLARVGVEEDPVAVLALASAVAARPDPSVEGQLLAWLAGDDPTLGAIAAEGLTARSDDHVTAALLASWRAHRGEEDWERRVAIMRAVADRPTVPPDYFGEALHDPNPHVRLAAFFALSGKAGRSQAGAPPLRRDAPELADPWFGVADVERAVVTTSGGDLTLLLYPKVAPAAVASFVALAEQGYFDGQLVHRVVPDFVVQSGDPTNTGWGGPGWTIPDEFSPLEYRRGTLGMARSDKDTAGSQWFITHSPQPHLTGHYTAFGQLMTGWEVLDAIRVGDVVERIVIQRKEAP
jgi:cyclophilin family peptidyl-prolyl cis-trans isomerase/HEAT repeat protein